jgi:hypothetical protein
MFVRSSEFESATVTRVLVPLNVSADPNLPWVVQVPDETVPALPCPDESATLVPPPSLNEYAATARSAEAVAVP